MKIKKVEIYSFDVPLFEPFRISIGTMSAANDVLVRVLTDSGPYGIGEALPLPADYQEKLRTATSPRPRPSGRFWSIKTRLTLKG